MSQLIVSTAMDISVPADRADEALAVINSARPPTEHPKADEPELVGKNVLEAALLAILAGPFGVLYSMTFDAWFKLMIVGIGVIAGLAYLEAVKPRASLATAYVAGIVLSVVLTAVHNHRVKRSARNEP